MATDTKTTPAKTIEDEWDVRSRITEAIGVFNPEQFTVFDIQASNEGLPQFAVIQPETGTAWIVTVGPALISPYPDEEVEGVSR